MTLVTPDDGKGCCPTCGQPTSLAVISTEARTALDAAVAAEREKVHYLQAVVRNALQWHEDHRVALQKVGPGTIPQWVTDGWAVLAAIRSGKAAADG